MLLPLQRLTAWLCLVVALLTGATPASGFVVCLEPDGCVRMEFGSGASGCGACEEHSESATDAPRGRHEANAADPSECPCLDLVLPVAPRSARLLPRSLEPASVVWSRPQAQPLLQPQASVAPHLASPPRPTPRPPDELACLASVVILR